MYERKNMLVTCITYDNTEGRLGKDTELKWGKIGRNASPIF